jgi:predicted HTH transcriptional regulator
VWEENDKKSCCALVKDILGMANTLGGFIVIGVSESSSGLSWDDMMTSQLDSFDTSRLNRFLQNYADPPINARLRKIEHQGKRYVIIEVPRFADTPHVCQKDFPGVLNAAAVYVRTDNNETGPLRSSADFRLMVEQAVRNRADMMLNSFRAILTHGSQGSGTRSAARAIRKTARSGDQSLRGPRSS